MSLGVLAMVKRGRQLAISAPSLGVNAVTKRSGLMYSRDDLGFQGSGREFLHAAQDHTATVMQLRARRPPPHIRPRRSRL